MKLHFARIVDETGARAWQAITEVAIPFDHPGLLADPFEEVVGRLPDDSRSKRTALYVGDDDGKPVVVGATEFPMADNLHLSSVEIQVPPQLRRHGYGRQMFELLRDRCREAGRSVLVGEVGSPLDGTSAGESFARALGARSVLVEIRRELRLEAVEPEALDEMEEQARSHATGYDLLQWIDHAPGEVLEDAARLAGRISTDAPMGDLTMEAERWDGARLRESEDETVCRGRMRVSTGVRHIASGRLVGYTDIAVARSRPQTAYQWGTLVAPEHRGHRLGTLIKIANLHNLMRELPGVQTVQTWNAMDNPHMVAINEAMGFGAVERFAHWQMEI